jgi:hypothetical protein
MPSPQPLRLPPNFTEDKFSEFISRAGKLCGQENIRVISSADELVDGDYMNPCKAHGSNIQLMIFGLVGSRRYLLRGWSLN